MKSTANTKYLLKKGNHKLSGTIGVWTLPRSTCIGAGACAKFCYAKKFENCPSVIASRQWRLEQISSSDFVERMIKEIKHRKFSFVRIHESGDYLNQEYLNKWKEIAKQCPEVTFFTFTKTFGLLDFSNTPTNFIMLQSYGSNHDQLLDYSKNTAKVVEKDYIPKEEEFLCPYGNEDFVSCGTTCSYCFTKGGIKHVAFRKH